VLNIKTIRGMSYLGGIRLVCGIIHFTCPFRALLLLWHFTTGAAWCWIELPLRGVIHTKGLKLVASSITTVWFLI